MLSTAEKYWPAAPKPATDTTSVYVEPLTPDPSTYDILKLVVVVKRWPVGLWARLYLSLRRHAALVQFMDGTQRSAEPVSKSMRKACPPIVMLPVQTDTQKIGQSGWCKNNRSRACCVSLTGRASLRHKRFALSSVDGSSSGV